MFFEDGDFEELFEAFGAVKNIHLTREKRGDARGYDFHEYKLLHTRCLRTLAIYVRLKTALEN